MNPPRLILAATAVAALLLVAVLAGRSAAPDRASGSQVERPRALAPGEGARVRVPDFGGRTPSLAPRPRPRHEQHPAAPPPASEPDHPTPPPTNPPPRTDPPPSNPPPSDPPPSDPPPIKNDGEN
jgi:hypothetical protein